MSSWQDILVSIESIKVYVLNVYLLGSFFFTTQILLVNGAGLRNSFYLGAQRLLSGPDSTWRLLEFCVSCPLTLGSLPSLTLVLVLTSCQMLPSFLFAKTKLSAYCFQSCFHSNQVLFC